MISNTFPGSDGRSNINYRIWEPEDTAPVAVVQVIHGMAEYVDRYAPLAGYLNQNGIVLAGEDHIGHGQSCDFNDRGYFGEKDGWLYMIKDVHKLHSILSERYPGVPGIMMGHSMGSFLCRAWLSMYGKEEREAGRLSGAIICGTAGPNPAAGAGVALCKMLRSLKGSRHISKTVNGIVFGPYARGVKNAGTTYDWLSRDEEVVDAYIKDPLCGFIFSLAGHQDLFTLLGYVSGKACFNALPKELCYLLIAGGEDPVGNFGKGVAEVVEMMEAAGCEDVSCVIYEGMRHEIHNEIGKEAVYEDIRDFCLDMADEAK